MRSRLEADTLLCQGLIWLVLIGYLAVVYVIVVAIGTLPFLHPGVDLSPAWWLNLLAFLLMALTFLPVYRWTRASVRALVYGQHENAYLALAELDQHLVATASPVDILPTIVETIANALKLPYVAIETRPANVRRAGAPLVIAFGQAPPGAEMQRVWLTYHDTILGELRAAARRWDEPLSTSDLTVLSYLARQVGIALHAAQLTEDVQSARERLVVAREEERRRIRNDLHDGLAPTLSALQLQLGAVRNLFRRNPEQAEALLNELRDDLRSATAEIRQLVYDLRPPMLDELGLAGAIRGLQLQGAAIRYGVEAPEPMPKLSAALEVAIYRIASEALHNVVKHAQATACEVRIEVAEGTLTLTVSDNGRSLPPGYPAGVGLQSMRERAAELGGTLAIGPNDGGGTCVAAQFPLGLQDQEV